MASLNKWIGIGRVGSEPVVNEVASGVVANLSIACTDKYTDRNGEKKESTEWVALVAWRNVADIVKQYVHKGDLIYVSGKLKTRTFQQQSGVSKSVSEVLVDVVTVLVSNQKHKVAQGEDQEDFTL